MKWQDLQPPEDRNQSSPSYDDYGGMTTGAWLAIIGIILLMIFGTIFAFSISHSMLGG